MTTNGHGEIASYLCEPLAQSDPEMYELIRKEKQRQVSFSLDFIIDFRLLSIDSWFGNDCIGEFYISRCFGNSWFMSNE